MFSFVASLKRKVGGVRSRRESEEPTAELSSNPRYAPLSNEGKAELEPASGASLGGTASTMSSDEQYVEALSAGYDLACGTDEQKMENSYNECEASIPMSNARSKYEEYVIVMSTDLREWCSDSADPSYIPLALREGATESSSSSRAACSKADGGEEDVLQANVQNDDEWYKEVANSLSTVGSRLDFKLPAELLRAAPICELLGNFGRPLRHRPDMMPHEEREKLWNHSKPVTSIDFCPVLPGTSPSIHESIVYGTLCSIAFLS